MWGRQAEGGAWLPVPWRCTGTRPTLILANGRLQHPRPGTKHFDIITINVRSLKQVLGVKKKRKEKASVNSYRSMLEQVVYQDMTRSCCGSCAKHRLRHHTWAGRDASHNLHGISSEDWIETFIRLLSWFTDARHQLCYDRRTQRDSEHVLYCILDTETKHKELEAIERLVLGVAFLVCTVFWNNTVVMTQKAHTFFFF